MFIRSTLAFGLDMAMQSAPVAAQGLTALMQAPPPAPFAKVSELVALPGFLPGLGQLIINPATLPAGPFLGYDHDGKLSATIYMVPIGALQDGTAFDDLAIGSHDVASVDIDYNVGHPGVDAGWQDAAPSSDDLPEVARTSFPGVDAILAHGQVLAQAAPGYPSAIAAPLGRADRGRAAPGRTGRAGVDPQAQPPAVPGATPLAHSTRVPAERWLGQYLSV